MDVPLEAPQKNVRRAQPPQGSRLAVALPRVDYLDAFAVDLAPGLDAPAACRAVFEHSPGWVRALMALRNRIVRLLGLRVVAAQGSPFHTFHSGAAEVVLGEDDAHLDFRVGVSVLPAPTHTRVVLSTAVQFHGWLGRVYFAPVGRIHPLVVRSFLRRAARSFPPQSRSLRAA